ncbi:MAG: transposase [Colwellia sp.]
MFGRKNWLFSNTANGVRASAMVYSIIETAKGNGLIPFDYIAHCLKQLSDDVDEKTIVAMLPWNVRLT